MSITAAQSGDLSMTESPPVFAIDQLYHGDTFELTAQLPDSSIDLVFTSPPYADMKVYESNSGIHPGNYVNWFMPLVKSLAAKVKSQGSFILNINDKVVDRFRHPYVFDLVSRICRETEWKLAERLFWDKGKYLPHPKRFGDRVEYLFWFAKQPDYYIDIDAFRRPYSEVSINRMKKPIKKRFSRNAENNDTVEYKGWAPNPKGALPSTLVSIGSESKRVSNSHFAVFPVSLASYFINGASKEGDLVFDPFVGSGTTAIAAKKLGRHYLGFDNGEKTIIEARARIAVS